MQPLVRVEALSKTYKDTVAINNVSFTIKKSSCMGLLGVNGAGKTTLLKIISGLLLPTKGNIFYDGELINSTKEFSNTHKQRVGYLAQYPKFYEWMSGTEFLGYIADLSGIPKKEKKQKVDEALQIVNLTESARKRISGYSGGMKQRLGIAQAILHSPDFLILDEPVSSLDPEGRYQIIQLLQQLKKKTTILFSTHILHDADSLCDDIIILSSGEKIIETKLKHLKDDYKEPIIKVNCLSSAAEVLPKLAQISFIVDVEGSGNSFTVRINDKQQALMELPKILLANNLPFDSFQVFEPTLEDIFLKVVNKNE